MDFTGRSRETSLPSFFSSLYSFSICLFSPPFLLSLSHFFLFSFSLSTTSLFEARVVRVSVSSGVEIYKMKYEIMVRALWLAKGTGAPISTPPCAYVPIRPAIRRSRVHMYAHTIYIRLAQVFRSCREHLTFVLTLIHA